MQSILKSRIPAASSNEFSAVSQVKNSVLSSTHYALKGIIAPGGPDQSKTPSEFDSKRKVDLVQRALKGGGGTAAAGGAPRDSTGFDLHSFKRRNSSLESLTMSSIRVICARCGTIKQVKSDIVCCENVDGRKRHRSKDSLSQTQV